MAPIPRFQQAAKGRNSFSNGFNMSRNGGRVSTGEAALQKESGRSQKVGSSKVNYPLVVTVGLIGFAALGTHLYLHRYIEAARKLKETGPLAYLPRQDLETSGFLAVFAGIEPWRSDAPLAEQAVAYKQAVRRGLWSMDRYLEKGFSAEALLQRASLFNANGDPASAFRTLEDMESLIKGTQQEGEWLYTIIYYKGATALRMGENDNCVLCRGESSCIFPIASAARHTNPTGSRLAIKHFSEYLQRFPDDLEVKWLLNLAHMTLGEHPAMVDPRHLLPLEYCAKSEFDIGKFRDVSHLVGMTRLNQSGGAIMDDFDNDGLLDFVVTSWAPSESMAIYRNRGDGTVEEQTKAAGLEEQLGGLYCVQTDYNNDGFLDIFIPRGSWMPPHT